MSRKVNLARVDALDNADPTHDTKVPGMYQERDGLISWDYGLLSRKGKD